METLNREYDNSLVGNAFGFLRTPLIFDPYEYKADIVITHGGTGAIVGALKKGKKVIAVPRLAKYGEHVDNHQLQLIEQFRESNLICECRNCNNLWKALKVAKSTEYTRYQSNTGRIIDSIEEFINKGEN